MSEISRQGSGSEIVQGSPAGNGVMFRAYIVVLEDFGLADRALKHVKAEIGSLKLKRHYPSGLLKTVCAYVGNGLMCASRILSAVRKIAPAQLYSGIVFRVRMKLLDAAEFLCERHYALIQFEIGAANRHHFLLQFHDQFADLHRQGLGAVGRLSLTKELLEFLEDTQQIARGADALAGSLDPFLKYLGVREVRHAHHPRDPQFWVSREDEGREVGQ